jgi:hypothetical protein
MAGYSEYTQYTEDVHTGRITAWDIVLWALQVAAAVAFCLTGAAKIAGSDEMVQRFATAGFGQWLRYATGAMEIAGALLIVFPGTAFVGAWLMALLMAATAIGHLTVLEISPVLPLSLLIAMVIVGIGRHKKKVHHVATHAAHPPHPVH